MFSISIWNVIDGIVRVIVLFCQLDKFFSTATNIFFMWISQLEKLKIDEKRKVEEQDVIRLMRQKDQYEIGMSLLKQELELSKKSYEKSCAELVTQAMETKAELEKKLKHTESLLNDSRKKVKELEAFSESKYLRWRRKEHGFKDFIDSHAGALQVCINFNLTIFSLSFPSLKDGKGVRKGEYHLVLVLSH